VEIQINHTVTTTDDLVPIKSLKPACASSNSVVLTNPDHRLRFPGDADTMLTIDLPTDGSWSNFEISGASGSAALKDAIIEVHCETEAGALLAKKPVTVFWFDGHMDITVGGKYEAFADLKFTVLGNPAVHLKASAQIKPDGVDCAAPQIKDLRVGIMQNSFPPDGSKARIRKVLFGPPDMDWLVQTKAGTAVKLPAQWHRTQEISQISNDSDPAAAPFYNLPPATGSTKPTQPKPPIGCKGGGSTESQDNPGTELGTIKVRVTDGSGGKPETEPVTDEFGKQLETAPVIGGTGTTLGTAVYPFQRVFHKEKWITWAVIFNLTTKAFCVLRQRTWTVNLDSDTSYSKHTQAVPDSADAEPTVVPITDPPFSNDLNKANWTTGPVSGPTIDRFKPKPP
jgi:hypothetical protein